MANRAARFRAERDRAATPPERISDERGSAILAHALHAARDPDAAARLRAEADEGRFGEKADEHRAAYVYLALAMSSIDDDPEEADTLFHFAGHTFREVGQLNRAADAYWRAGALAADAVATHGGTEARAAWAVRSFARAKVLYAEIGESDRSDRMHMLEWEARRLTGAHPITALWGATCRYGTDLGRWLVWLVAIVAVYAIAYQAWAGDFADAQHTWSWGVSAAYAAIAGVGDHEPETSWAQLLATSNVVVMYVMLAIGATILGRRVLGR
ncbi:MAG: hypothetical protein HZB46_13740 [Solirubrobacterales bacterium]|nr:hypothetical protein [Solirubrobacterales bacterium]